MPRPARTIRVMKRLCPCGLGAALILVGVIAVLGQDGPRPGAGRTDAGEPYPRLPGAVTKAPDWIGADAPFDVAKFFAALPRDRNAAPLYLDALFEFNSEMAVCFPEGPERDRRRLAATDRMKQYMEIYERLRNADIDVPPEAIDAVIAMYRDRVPQVGRGRRATMRLRARPGGRGALPSPASRPTGRPRGAAEGSARGRSAGFRCRDRRGTGGAPAGPRPRPRPLDQPVGRGGHHPGRLRRSGQDHPRQPRPPGRALRSPAQAAPRPRGELGPTAMPRALWGASEQSHGAVIRKPQLALLTTPAQRDQVVRDLNDYYRTMLELGDRPFAGRLKMIATLKIARRRLAGCHGRGYSVPPSRLSCKRWGGRPRPSAPWNA